MNRFLPEATKLVQKRLGIAQDFGAHLGEDAARVKEDAYFLSFYAQFLANLEIVDLKAKR